MKYITVLFCLAFSGLGFGAILTGTSTAQTGGGLGLSNLGGGSGGGLAGGLLSGAGGKGGVGILGVLQGKKGSADFINGVLGGAVLGAVDTLTVGLTGIQEGDIRYHPGPENLLDTHDCVVPTDTKLFNATMGPCFDTTGCKLPACCGIIAGRQSLFTLTYRASKPLRKGHFDGLLKGLVIGSADQHIELNTPVVKVPNILASYNSTLSNSTTVPQRVGKIYKITLPFEFPTTLCTSLGVICDFVATIYDDFGRDAGCWALHARLVNADFLSSILDIGKGNPLKAIDNIGSVSTLATSLAGNRII